MVNLEIIRILQGAIISKDNNLECQKNKKSIKVNSINLNEELGQIDYIFCDKTGTLTQNLLQFKKIFVNGWSYG